MHPNVHCVHLTQKRAAMWLFPFLIVFSSQAFSDERASEDCGQKAIDLVLARFLPSDTSSFSLENELGSGPMSVEDVIAYLRAQGLTVTAQRVDKGDYAKRLSQIVNPNVGLALVGANRNEAGHYFFLHRTADGSLVMIEPVSSRSTQIDVDRLNEVELDQQLILILVSKAPELNFMLTLGIFLVALGALTYCIRCRPPTWQLVYICCVLVGLTIWIVNPSIQARLSMPPRFQETPRGQAHETMSVEQGNEKINSSFLVVAKRIEGVRLNSPTLFEFELHNNTMYLLMT